MWDARRGAPRQETSPRHPGLLEATKQRVLANPIRASMLDLVRRRPGILQSELAAHLGHARATVRHHLNALERAGYLRVVSSAQRSAAFPSGSTAQRGEALAILQRGRTRELVELVARQPGLAQNEITARLGLSRKVFRKYMDRLVAAGLVEEAASPPFLHYFPTSGLERLAHDTGILGVLPMPFQSPTVAEPAVAVAAPPGLDLVADDAATLPLLRTVLR